MRVRLGRPGERTIQSRAGSGLRPAVAAEYEAAKGEAEPEGAKCEGADGNPLTPDRQPLPVAERLFFLLRQLFPPPLLAQGAPGLEPKVEVVEYLRRLL